MKGFFTIIFLLPLFVSFSQKLPSVQILHDSIGSSFRGLSVPSDNVIWVSGSNGTVGRSVNGGKDWKWIIVPGFEKRDFRDIEAFDSSVAIIMAVDNPANILKTTDGGKTWKVVFHKEQEGMFLDAMDFIGNNGICIGDPMIIRPDKGLRFYMLHSEDMGDTWTEDLYPTLRFGPSAIFAASGSNIFISDIDSSQSYFISGGVYSRLYLKKKNKDRVYSRSIPVMKGKTTSGAFSFVPVNNKRFYIAGGDYNEYWIDSGNVVYTTNAGKTWKRSSVHGYRSCIIAVNKNTFITCGTNGVDISFDGCKTWKLIHGDGARGTDGFNVCAKSKKGRAIYFAGSGRIAKLIP